MKKRIKSIISFYGAICVCFVLSACGNVKEEQSGEESEINVSVEYVVQPEREEYSKTENDVEHIEIENTKDAEHVEESAAADTDYQNIEDEVYRNLILEMMKTGTFPATDGTPCSGMIYDNSYSVTDIDDDGKEELLISYANASCMAGMVLYIYDYDRETKEIYIEYAGWPNMTVYDNGYIKEEASHNHGRSNLDDFWPYALLKYNDQIDKYEYIASIDAWQYQISEDIDPDPEFPKEKDLDGDGIVYYFISENYYEPTQIMDNAEYAAWCEQYSEGSTKEIIWYSIISEKKYYEMKGIIDNPS